MRRAHPQPLPVLHPTPAPRSPLPAPRCRRPSRSCRRLAHLPRTMSKVGARDQHWEIRSKMQPLVPNLDQTIPDPPAVASTSRRRALASPRYAARESRGTKQVSARSSRAHRVPSRATAGPRPGRHGSPIQKAPAIPARFGFVSAIRHSKFALREFQRGAER
jgi:hypothetical protein